MAERWVPAEHADALAEAVERAIKTCIGLNGDPEHIGRCVICDDLRQAVTRFSEATPAQQMTENGEPFVMDGTEDQSRCSICGSGLVVDDERETGWRCPDESEHGKLLVDPIPVQDVNYSPEEWREILAAADEIAGQPLCDHGPNKACSNCPPGPTP